MVQLRSWLVALVVFLAGAYALVGLQQRIDRARADFQWEKDFLYVSEPAWLKRLALGYDGLLGCVYWTRVVQHYGRQRLGEQKYSLLFPLLDITTTLDPELIIAYRFGAFFLSEEPPKGPGEYAKAVRLLKKGIRHHPDYWRFWYDLGFLHYREKNYQRAADAFHRGAQHPGSPAWMNALAARVATEGGQRSFAQYLWRQLYRSTDDPAIRENARAHLEGLQADENIEGLQKLVERYEQKTGRRPDSFQDLVEADMLPGTPVDPRNYPYVIDDRGRVRLHPESPIEYSELGREEK